MSLPTTVSRTLKTTLTQAERHDRSLQAADKEAEATKAETEAAAYQMKAKEQKEIAAGKAAERRDLLRVVKDGWEMRVVDVRIQWAQDNRQIEEVRMDTGEVLLTRAPLPHEQQEQLPAIIQIGSAKGKKRTEN